MLDNLLTLLMQIVTGIIYLGFLILPFYLIASLIHAFWKDHKGNKKNGISIKGNFTSNSQKKNKDEQ